VTTAPHPGRTSPKRRRRLLGTLVVAGVLASATYAFTASNTVPSTNAGVGSGAINNYTASGVSYQLNASTPTNIDSVSFTIAPTVGVVKVKLASGGAWYACTNSSGSVSCDTTSPQATIDAATELTVVAAQ